MLLLALGALAVWTTAATISPAAARTLREKAPLLTALALAFAAWELTTAKSGVLPLPFFPSPAKVLSALVDDRGILAVSALHSLRLLSVGYLAGVAAGLPTGIAMGWNPRFHYWLSPLVRVIGPIPSTAWIPLAMVAFPTSFSASVFLIALAAWFPVTVMTWSGVGNVSRSYFDVARTLGADERGLVLRVALPAALPTVFVGLFMGLGMAFVTLVVGEMLGVRAGLGWYIQWAQGWGEYYKIYAALAIMAGLFSALITLLFKARDRFLSWQKGLIRW